MNDIETKLITDFNLSPEEAAKTYKVYGDKFLEKAMKRCPFKTKELLRSTIKTILKNGL